MILVFEGLDAETLAVLRAPMRGPDGAAFQVIDMQAALDEDESYRVTASLALADGVDAGPVAEWLWEWIEDRAPMVMTVGEARARVGEPAALSWLIDKAR